MSGCGSSSPCFGCPRPIANRVEAKYFVPSMDCGGGSNCCKSACSSFCCPHTSLKPGGLPCQYPCICKAHCYNTTPCQKPCNF